MKGYDIKLRLKDVKPKTWRDLIIPSNITFHQMHRIIQIAFGFLDCHLYLFDMGDRRIVNFKTTDKMVGDLDSNNVIIEDYFDNSKKIRYCYDFGDTWEVIIQIKGTVEYNREYPKIIRYKGDYNPPEDCGGPFIFTLLLDNIINGNKEILSLTDETIYQEYIEDTERIDKEYTQYLLIGEFDYEEEYYDGTTFVDEYGENEEYQNIYGEEEEDDDEEYYYEDEDEYEDGDEDEYEDEEYYDDENDDDWDEDEYEDEEYYDDENEDNEDDNNENNT